MGEVDGLGLLTRTDKWFLGGGKGAIYAPPFPKFLTSPGFWDECFFADIRLARLFTVLVLDDVGRPVRFASEIVDWRPDRLVLMHRSEGVTLLETRCVTEGQAWVSEIEVRSSRTNLNLFQWSLPEISSLRSGSPWQSAHSVVVDPEQLGFCLDTAWPVEMAPDRTAVENEAIRPEADAGMGEPLTLFLRLGGSVPRRSFTVNLTQRHDDAPLYELSVLPEKFQEGRLAGDVKAAGGPAPLEGMLHLVQHFSAGQGDRIILACGVGLEDAAAQRALDDAREPGVIQRSERAWRRYFSGVPQFRSSDPWLNATYWNRWAGLRLNTVDVPGLPIAGKAGQEFSPFVTEGIGFFRNFITYSAQAHLREVAWMHSPDLGQGILENLAKCQRADGSIPGHNYSARPARDFYHADFATGAAQWEALHGSEVSKSVREALTRYADYFNRVRRFSPDSGLMCIFDQNETGQEYMSRYQVASADAEHWESFRVGGVDASTYIALLKRYLGQEASEAEFLDQCWNAEDAYFCDILADGRQSPARPATGLYALLLLGARDRVRIHACHDRWLPEFCEFEGRPAKGFPATAFSDPTFSAEGEWREKRLNCPWNGRSWPMTNSHLVDALAHSARVTADPELRQKAAQALMMTVRLLFHDNDPGRPCSYEHYNPVTGVPALYRGYDDYMHSWVVDLILRHAVGVQPGVETVDPLPLDVDWIECSEIPHPEGRMSVRLERGRPPHVQMSTNNG
jgi:hypothetical protein